MAVLISLLFSLNLFAAGGDIPQSIPQSQIQNLSTFDGKPIVLGQKKKTLLYFWATWCTTCRQKFAHGELDSLEQNPNVEVIAINTDKEADRARSFLERSPPKISVAQDTSHELTTSLKVVALPFWAVIEKAADGMSWKILSAQEGGDLTEMRRALSL